MTVNNEFQIDIEPQESSPAVEYVKSTTPNFQTFHSQISISNQPTALTRANLEKHGLAALLQQIRSHRNHEEGVEVTLNDVNYNATFTQPLDAETTKHPIHTVIKPFDGEYSSLFKKKKKFTQHVLHNINAVFKPGTMTLILGPPSCGKTTLLNLIAEGSLSVHKNETFSGTIRYNAELPEKLDLTKIATLVSQDDVHVPTLTVMETLNFAHQCQQGTSGAQEDSMDVEALVTLLGLEECEETVVGDDLLRGVSGGQKKRVTIGEMLCSLLSQDVVCMDEFSTGLDSATTCEITRVLHEFTHHLKKTTIVAMLQPPPEVYELFDNILVLDAGEQIYSGSRADLPAYFESIGYRCPARKDIADFIQEVTTPTGRQYIVSNEMEVNSPQTPEQFANSFRQSPYARAKVTPQIKQIDKEKEKLGFFASLKILGQRQIQQTVRDVELMQVRIGQAVIMGFIIGTLFYDVDKENVQMKMGLLFLSLLFQALTTFSAVDAVFRLRNVLYKQMDRGFFPVLSYSIVESIVEVVSCIPQAILFSTPIYWLTGLSASASTFLFFLVMVILIGLVYMQLFKLAAAISPDVNLAKICCGGTIFLGQVFSGYMIPEDNIPAGWVGLYWVNPFTWALRALALNEFKSSTYDDLLLNKMRMGDVFLKSFGLPTSKQYMIGAVFVLLAMYIFLLVCTVLAYSFIRYRNKSYYYTGTSYSEDENISAKRASISTEFIPITLSFQDLSYSITVSKNEERVLLNNIHGYFLPGTLTALMGSTGAGKTTLLDVLSGRKVNRNEEEKIYINGRLMDDPHEISHVMGYVEQNDIHVASSTVKEAFEFSAKLRLSSKDLLHEKEIVEEMLMLLELDPDRLVSNLSPGERKRLTIGVELVSNPSVLFCDEPTSGLDARAAHRVVTCLERIARSGRTVICTIHQPSTSLFEMFDNLILLQTGGKMVYFGPLGGQESNILVNYFHDVIDKGDDLKRKQSCRRIHLNENPATYMLECLSKTSEICFPSEYLSSQEYQETEHKIKQLNHMSSDSNLVFSKKYQHSFFRQIRLLFQRFSAQYWRSPSFNTSRLFLGVFFACVYGSVYSGQDQISTTLDLFSRMNLLFIGPLFMGICCMMMALPVISADRAVFYRERASRMYSVAAYSMSLAFIEALYSLVIGSVFVNIFYWYVGLEQATDSWLWFWAVNILGILTWVYIGHFLVFVLNDLQSAVVIAGAISSLMVIFSGFMINEAEMPDFWTFLYWISPTHYQLEAIIVTQFSQNQNLIEVSENPGQHVPVAVAASSFFGEAFDYSHRWTNLGVLVLIISLFQLGSYLSLKFINHLKR